MSTLDALAQGFAVALTPFNLLWSLVGVTLGTAVGVLPGIGPARKKALLLYFGDLKRITGASIDELMRVKGIGEDAARHIRAVLDGKAQLHIHKG